MLSLVQQFFRCAHDLVTPADPQPELIILTRRHIAIEQSHLRKAITPDYRLRSRSDVVVKQFQLVADRPIEQRRFSKHSKLVFIIIEERIAVAVDHSYSGIVEKAELCRDFFRCPNIIVV